MSCGNKKQTQTSGVHLTERTCSPYNPIIKQIVDDCLGLPIYPVTSIDAIIDEEGNTLRKLLQDLLDQIKDGGFDVSDKIAQIMQAIDELQDNSAGNEEFQELKDLVQAIASGTDIGTNNQAIVLPNSNTPVIVNVVNKILEYLGIDPSNPGDPLPSANILDLLINLVADIANFNTDALTSQYSTLGINQSGFDPTIPIISKVLELISFIGIPEVWKGDNLHERVLNLEERVGDLEEGGDVAQAGYAPPEGGIPKTDLAPSVQTSLGKADTAVQDSNYVHTDNNFSTDEKTKLAGLSNYNDAALQSAINSLQTALNALVNGQSVTDAIDTFNEVIDFLDEIDTDDPTLKSQLLALNNAITALQTTLEGKLGGIKKADGTSLPVTNGVVTLPLIPTQQDIVDAVEDAMEDYERPETVVINSDGANIVDEHDNNSVLVAPSARQMKLMYNNLMAMYNGLANSAFTEGRPSLDWVGTFPTHKITIGTLTDVAVSYNGSSQSTGSEITANEGEVILKLTSANNKMILANGISIKRGNANVAFKTSAGTGDDEGSTLVTFVLSGDTTFSAEASIGITIQLSGTNSVNVNKNVDGIGLSGDNRVIVLSHPEHYHWDDTTIELSVNSQTLNPQSDYTIADNQDGTKTITVLKEFNESSETTLVINVGALEDDYVTLNFNNVGEGVVVKCGSDTLQSGKFYGYKGVTINISTAATNKFTAAPTATIGENSATITGSSVYDSYSFVIGNDVTSGTTVVITAAVTMRSSCSVGIQSIANFDVDYFEADGTTQITETNNAVSVLEGNGVKIKLTPSANYAVAISSITMGIDSLTPSIDYSVTDSNGVLTISIESVTAAVVVSASASLAYKVTNHFINMESTGGSSAANGENYTAIISPVAGAIYTYLRVFVDGSLLTKHSDTVDGDYEYDSTTGQLTIYASSITGDIDICSTARKTTISVTVKAGTSTTVNIKRSKSISTGTIINETIDATSSEEDIVKEYNFPETSIWWSFGTPAAVKEFDLAGIPTPTTDYKDFDGFSNLEKVSNLAVNISATYLYYFFRNCTKLVGDYDFMTWRINSVNNILQFINGTKINAITPYAPALSSLKGYLQYAKGSRFIINKTANVSSLESFAHGASNLKYVDISRCNVTSSCTVLTTCFYQASSNITLKVGNFDLSGVTATNQHYCANVKTLICTTSTPPNNALFTYFTGLTAIYVPTANVEDYKSAWQNKANIIHPISDYMEE